jgi:hypothetical protein
MASQTVLIFQSAHVQTTFGRVHVKKEEEKKPTNLTRCRIPQRPAVQSDVLVGTLNSSIKGQA